MNKGELPKRAKAVKQKDCRMITKCYVTLFSGHSTNAYPLVTLNNVEPYISVTLFSWKSDTLPPPTVLRNTEWPLEGYLTSRIDLEGKGQYELMMEEKQKKEVNSDQPRPASCREHAGKRRLKQEKGLCIFTNTCTHEK